MKTLVFVLVIFIAPINLAFSQGHKNNSSELSDLHQQNSIWNQIDSISRYAWLCNVKLKYDSAIICYNHVLSMAPADVHPSWQANIYVGLGFSYYALDQWDSAYAFDQRALSIFQSLNDTSNIIVSHSNLALAYISKGLFEEALANSLNALSFLGSTPTYSHASCYNNLAIIFKTTNNYEDAAMYFRKALKIFIQLDQRLEIAKSYNNLGELFTQTRQYDSAKRNLLLAAKIKRELNDNQGLARTLTRLGKVLILTNNFNKAESQLTESLQTQRAIKDTVGMIETLNNLGELYLSTFQLSKASSPLQEANTIIHCCGTPDYLRQNLELRIKLAREQRDFATGMTLQDELAIVRDSLLNEEKSRSLQAMQIRYETKKKEQEITLLQQREEVSKAKIKSNRILIIALGTGIALVGTIGTLVYLNLRNTRAAKLRFELLLSETRHRIKNNLQTLASIFHLQTRHYTDQAMILEARSSESRVHTMSLLHERFYTGEADHIINTQSYIKDLIDKLVDIYGSETPNLKVNCNIQSIDLDIDKALALSLIMQELVCNAFKYAFDHQPDPELSVDIRLEGDNVITIISDNGVGFTDKKQTGVASQGLNLVDALVSQLDGEMTIENDSGTRFRIKFPGKSLWTKPAF